MADLAPSVRGPVVVDDRVGSGATVVAVVCGLLLATRQSAVVPFTLGLTPVTVTWCVCGLLVLLCWLAGQRLPAPDRATTLLVMASLLGTLVSSGALMLRGPAGDTAGLSLLLLSREVVLTAAVVFVLLVVRTPAALTRVVQGIVVGASVSALFAVVQVLVGADLASSVVLPGLVDQGNAANPAALLRAGALRPQGSAGHPLELSAVLTVCFPLALGLTYSQRARAARWVPWAALSGLIALGAASTISRSAIIGVVAALAVMSWRWPVRRVVVGGSALVVLVAAAVVSGVPVAARLASVLVGGSSDNSIGSRTSGLSYALERLPLHWLTGQGAGTYDVANQPVLDNYYLTRLVESGLVGLATLLLMVGGAWCLAFAASRRAVTSASPGAFELVNGLLGAVTAVIVVALVLDIGGFAQISTLLYVLVALVGSAAVFTRQEHGS